MVLMRYYMFSLREPTLIIINSTLTFPSAVELNLNLALILFVLRPENINVKINVLIFVLINVFAVRHFL